MTFFVFDRWGTQKGTLDGIISATHKDELNGEDSLTLKLTDCTLTKGDRVVWRDKFGVWHEHIANDIDDTHADAKIVSTVYCETSLAELYLDYVDDVRPYNTTATVALQRALANTRWQLGTVNVTGTSSAIFYHISAREALTETVEAWGGELSSTITVSGTGVVTRAVNLQTRRGADEGKRFEWSKDIKNISRRVYPDDVVTALYGYGKGLEVYDEDGNLTGGYSRKLTFGDINGGLDYVADETARLTWGIPDAQGNKAHAFGRVEFHDCEDMAELLQLTTDKLQELKQPQVEYTASVLDLADAGYQFEDVRTGDTVALIDDELGERLQGRVLCVERDLFNEQATVITLGNLTRSIGDVIASNQENLGRLNDHSAAWDNAASLSTSYVDAVINSLNHDMNLTGGYVYFEQGQGIVVYDRARDDNPTMAIQLTGAGFRIANSKTAQGEWDWRTFGTGDGFTADELIAGTIRGGNSYWNLETGDMTLANSITIGSQTVAQLETNVSNAAKTATNYIQADSTGLNIFRSATALSNGTYQRLTSTAQEFYINGARISQQTANKLEMCGGKADVRAATGSTSSGARIETIYVETDGSDLTSHHDGARIELQNYDVGGTNEQTSIEFYADRLAVGKYRTTAGSYYTNYIDPHPADTSGICARVGSSTVAWYALIRGMVLVQFCANGVTSAVTSGTRDWGAVIPSHLRPSVDVYGSIWTGTSGGAVATVSSDGHLYVYSASASTYALGQVVWQVEPFSDYQA